MTISPIFSSKFTDSLVIANLSKILFTNSLYSFAEVRLSSAIDSICCRQLFAFRSFFVFFCFFGTLVTAASSDVSLSDDFRRVGLVRIGLASLALSRGEERGETLGLLFWVRNFDMAEIDRSALLINFFFLLDPPLSFEFAPFFGVSVGVVGGSWISFRELLDSPSDVSGSLL